MSEKVRKCLQEVKVSERVRKCLMIELQVSERGEGVQKGVKVSEGNRAA